MATPQRIINVYVTDRVYKVNLDTEEVLAKVFRGYTWRWARVSSKRIETAAILRASDSWHRRKSTAPQHDVPQESKDLPAA